MCVVGICGGCVDVWLCSTGMLLKLLCILLRHSMCIVICMCAQGCVIYMYVCSRVCNIFSWLHKMPNS